MHQVFERSCERVPGAVALECAEQTLSYAELDAQANRLAHYLFGLGVGAGSRVAILLPRSVFTYVALLGVGKSGAAFVPIDPGAPPDRVAYIAGDAGVDAVLTTSELAPRCDAGSRLTIAMDEIAAELAAMPSGRPVAAADAEVVDADPVAYVMYTSGSSGRPKGVEVGQSSICNFLDVVPAVYDVRPGDRVYQGMTVSFDFSIEEIWPTWAVGATVVAGPAGAARLGGELADFLEERRITVLYCVPTLLATIPRELPDISTVLVGGEACPAQLVERWSRPRRRMLNTYGPTEATVTATWAELRPARPVTIGRPLPTYSVVLLDEDLEPVPEGATGEICIGGPGVARGYIGRPELTAERFVAHPLAPAGGRLYRTGDLGRMTGTGEIEYLGRADAEVKIRGHRVDLGEIDNVMLEDPAVAEAVAALVPVPGAGPDSRELAGYLVRAPGRDVEGAEADADETLLRRLHGRLRERLPGYMVPAFLQVVTELPTMPSGKVDRTRLPQVTGRRLGAAGPGAPGAAGAAGAVAAAVGELETRLRAAWAQTLGIPAEALSVEADFFTDLGGHSLLAAQVVSLQRTGGIEPAPTLRDLYAHPTVRSLACYLSSVDTTARVSEQPRGRALRHRGGRIAAAGAGQAAMVYLLLLVVGFPLCAVLYLGEHGESLTRLLGTLLAAVLVGYLVLHWLLPVLLVRPLAAGIRPGRFPLWGTVYLRVWLAGLLLGLSPLPALSGSPLMAPYLRLLGARVGSRTTIATSAISLPRLLSVGSDASVGYGATLHPSRVEDGWVIIDGIEIGAGAFVGANAVLEPGARLGVRAGLGSQSVLAGDDAVPPGARWAGSPARPVRDLGAVVEAMLGERTTLPGWRPAHVAASVAGLTLLEIAALATVLPSLALLLWALFSLGILAALGAVLLTGPLFVLTVCAVVAVGKRLALPSVPVGVHPARSWLGLRKWLVDRLLGFSLAHTNSLYATLYTVPWLRLLGARVGRGAEVSTAAHLDPDLLTLGDGSFVADMASVGPATFAAGRVTFLPTEVGRRAFVGNAAVVPAGTRTGTGSLVGVATVPPETGVPSDTSWLGSPAFVLPRRQDSGSFPEELTFRPTRGAVLHRLGVEFFRATLPATVHGVAFFLFLLALAELAAGPSLLLPALAAPVLAMLAGAAVVAYCVAVKRNVVGTYRPRVEPLWSRFVRRTEFVTGLYEAAAVPAGVGLLVGTPFLPAVLRRFGAHIGRRTWIGTTYLTEFDLVEIGDDAAVGAGVSLQTHLFEDRIMKMSKVTVRSGSTVGARTVVLYDSVVGEDVSLGALSLLMKGETLRRGTSWRGIPAQGVRHRQAQSAPAPSEPIRAGCSEADAA